MINKSYSKLTNEEKQIIIKAYFQKMPAMEIQKTLRISRRCYGSVLKEFGINGRLKNRYFLDECFFDQIDTDSKAYILGFIAADGYVGDKKHNNIVISSKDVYILKKIKNEILFSGDIKGGGYGGFVNSGECFRISFSNKHMADLLRNMGIVPNKSLTFFRIPRNIPIKFRVSFIRGYFDGDGSITYYERRYLKNDREYTYPRGEMSIIATKPLLYEFISVLGIHKYSIKESKTSGLYYLFVSSKYELRKIYKDFYENSKICLDRKKNLWDKLIWAFGSK